MKLENLKSLEISLNESANIDSRYFKQNDNGTYSPTQTLVYNIMRDAAEYYKDQIFDLDTDCLYHTEKLAEMKDTWQEKLNNDERERKYGPQLKELEKRKKAWREENIDKCDTRAGGPDLGDIDELRYFAGYTPESKPTLHQAVALYKYLKEYSNANKDVMKAELPQKEDSLLVKDQYKAEYKALCDKWSEELGIPVVTEQVGTVTRTKYSINQLRNANMKAVASSDVGLESYVEGLIKYLTSTTKIDFKQRLAEKDELINQDFVVNFNDRVKDLKAVEVDEVTGTIEIYTKLSDAAGPMKLISIAKEDPSNNYHKYELNAEVDSETLRYTRKINTKADLRKALEVSIGMIADTSFKKYSIDLQNFLDTL